MKKRNLFLQTAVASALVIVAAGAQAGTLSGTAAFATESFGLTATAALGIATPVITYTFNTPGGIVVNNNGIIYAYFRLTTGTFSAAPAAGAFAGTVAVAGTTLTASAPTLSADSTTVRVTLTNASGANVVIGVGNTLTFTGAAGSIIGVNTALSTAGGSVGIQASISTNGAAVPSVGTPTPADLDNGLSATPNFATARAAITGTVVASSALATAETAKIDLSAVSGPGTRFTTPGGALSNVNSATILNLGSVTFANVAATVQRDAATAYTVASSTGAGALSGTVTGVFKAGSTAALTTDTACVTPIGTNPNGTLNAGSTVFTFTGALTPAAVNYVCLTVPGTTGAIPSTTPVAAFTVAKATATDAASTASGNLYALTTNGQVYDVRNYVPAAVTGYTTFIRIINTGAVSATFSGQFINADGTTPGASSALATIAAGGSVTLSSTQVEAAMGGAPVGGISARPRLRITAPTNGMNVQSQLANNSTGVYTDFNGAQ